MKLQNILLCFLFYSLSATAENREILFEGYSKIMSGGVHVGYIFSRYEYSPKDKKFYGGYLIKTGALGSDITESLKAVSDEKLVPLKYEYTSIVNTNGKTESKTIDAQFAKGQMTAKVTTQSGKDPAKTITVRESLPKGVFLSSFQVYLMLRSKKGIQSDTKYAYKAIAEEDAKIYSGEALVKKQEKYKGLMSYKIFNRFKDAQFVSYVTDKGDILATVDPARSIGTELVAKPSEATASFPVSTSILKNLFGEVPTGTQNAMSQRAQLEAMPPTPTPNPKQEGVPQGQGIQIKPTTGPQEPPKTQ